MGEWEKTRKRETVSGKGREGENKGLCDCERKRGGEKRREGQKKKERGNEGEREEKYRERGRQHILFSQSTIFDGSEK